MREKTWKQIDLYYRRVLGPDWQTTAAPRAIGTWEIVEALWPLNGMFKPHFALLRELPYVKSLEPEADDALVAFAAGKVWGPTDPRPGVWRVLLERHVQALSVLLLNDAQGAAPSITVPQGLSAAQLTPALALFALHRMKLPTPLIEWSAHESFPFDAPPTLYRQ